MRLIPALEIAVASALVMTGSAALADASCPQGFKSVLTCVDPRPTPNDFSAPVGLNLCASANNSGVSEIVFAFQNGKTLTEAATRAGDDPSNVGPNNLFTPADPKAPFYVYFDVAGGYIGGLVRANGGPNNGELMAKLDCKKTN